MTYFWNGSWNCRKFWEFSACFCRFDQEMLMKFHKIKTNHVNISQPFHTFFFFKNFFVWQLQVDFLPLYYDANSIILHNWSSCISPQFYNFLLFSFTFVICLSRLLSLIKVQIFYHDVCNWFQSSDAVVYSANGLCVCLHWIIAVLFTNCS